MLLLRTQLGSTLRGHRLRQRRTLRDVSGAARVSLGYLSEVERGQKEASSELLSSICNALEVPMSTVLRAVSDRVAAVEGLPVAVRPAAATPVVTPAAPVLAGFDVPEPTAPALPVGDLGLKQVVITRDGLVSAA